MAKVSAVSALLSERTRRRGGRPTQRPASAAVESGESSLRRNHARARQARRTRARDFVRLSRDIGGFGAARRREAGRSRALGWATSSSIWVDRSRRGVEVANGYWPRTIPRFLRARTATRRSSPRSHSHSLSIALTRDRRRMYARDHHSPRALPSRSSTRTFTRTSRVDHRVLTSLRISLHQAIRCSSNNWTEVCHASQVRVPANDLLENLQAR